MTRRQFFVLLLAPLFAAWARLLPKPKIGRLYRDPGGPLVVGYKGKSVLDAGYFYCPYIPLYTTPMIVADQFVPRAKFRTRYGRTT